MQNITITGRLTSDASLYKSEKSDTTFMRCTIAVNAFWGDAKTTTFYKISIPKSGVFDYLKKGTAVAVNGELRIGMYTKEDKTGLDINIDKARIELVGSKPQDE